MKLFVTGGTGLLGSNIIALAEGRENIEAVASQYRSEFGPDRRWEAVQMNLEDAPSVQKTIELHKPDVIVHAAIPRDLLRMEFEKDWSWNVVVNGTRALAEAGRRFDSRLILVSTDWIFGNGGTPPYREDSPPCPVCYYGLLKVVCEALVSSICPNFAIARTAGVYGLNPGCPDYEQKRQGTGLGGFVDYCLYQFRQGKEAAVWMEHVNMSANTALVTDVAEAVLALASTDHRGIFHCCGHEGVNRIELAQRVAHVFGYPHELVRVATPLELTAELDVANERPAPVDTRLDVDSTETRLTRKLLTLDESLYRYKEQLQHADERTRALLLNSSS